jgi:hypothetical protein
MDTLPPTSAEALTPAGPLLGLLSRGLDLWLRQQCSLIEGLEIQLEGSAAQLMRGRLEGVRLRARRVVYQNLRFDRVELASGVIRVRMGALLRGQSLKLEHPFQVRGSVAFSGPDLGVSLATPSWRSLGDGLAEEILGLTPLAGLRIEEERLVLIAHGSGGGRPLEVATSVRAVEGNLEVLSLDGGALARLPMDPAIRIEQAQIGGGLLQLLGEARVSP